MSASDSEWLHKVMSWSLKATSISASPDGEPDRNKLHEGIVRSRRIVSTYNYVVLGFVAIVAVTHWAQKVVRWRRSRALRIHIARGGEDSTITRSSLDNNDQDIKCVYSSSASTADDSIDSPGKDIDQNEESPLLRAEASNSSSSFRKPLSASVQALWMYQPPPIPTVNKTLPSVGTSLLVLVFLAINIFYTFYKITFNTFGIFVLADRCGLVFVANLPLLYLLAAKNQPLKVLTGRSYESLNIFHRRLGELLCFEAFLHSAGMMAAWYVVIRPNGFSLIRFLLLKTCLLGIGAFFAYEALYFTSLGSFRARWYELFLFSHIMLQIAGLVFLYFHHAFARQYVVAALGIFITDRIIYRLGIKRTTVEAVTKILEDEDTVRISATIPLQQPTILSKIFGHALSKGWEATDHVFLTVPSLSSRHVMQAHPFTIASASPCRDSDEGQMDLLIRAQDGFSTDLLNAARLHKQLTITLDGPYGSSHARDMLELSDLSILVAGGSGIAVCWPLMHHILQIQNSRFNTVTSTHAYLPSHLYSSFDPESGISSSAPLPFPSRPQKVILIWIIHESTHLSWLSRPAMYEAELQGAEIIVPRATAEVGRPDLKCMIRELVDTYAPGRERKIRVVASGPDGMGRAVRNTCAGLAGEGRDVDICVEKFGW